jgi:predicted metalloprotease with PDZ domain
MAAAISSHEARPGRFEQSAVDASWRTWDEGPFGGDPETTISCYQKGAVLGLLIDLAIRHETHGRRSLDDVMRYLYQQYHQKQQRGYTEQEFDEACQSIAAATLSEVLGYAKNTEPIRYAKYLGYAGLRLQRGETNVADQPSQMSIEMIEEPTALQLEIRDQWLRGLDGG